MMLITCLRKVPGYVSILSAITRGMCSDVHLSLSASRHYMSGVDARRCIHTIMDVALRPNSSCTIRVNVYRIQ